MRAISSTALTTKAYLRMRAAPQFSWKQNLRVVKNSEMQQAVLKKKENETKGSRSQFPFVGIYGSNPDPFYLLFVAALRRME